MIDAIIIGLREIVGTVGLMGKLLLRQLLLLSNYMFKEWLEVGLKILLIRGFIGLPHSLIYKFTILQMY